MSSSNASWTTVSNTKKAKPAPSSNNKASANSAAPVIPKAEVKSIKLSDSAFSAMRSRISDDEDQENEVPKVTSNVEKASMNKPMKATKPSSNGLTLKQALQNIDVDKLKELYQSSKDNPSLALDKVCYWFVDQVKEVTSGTNDSLFSKETNPEYPISSLSTAVRKYLDEIFDNTKSKLKAVTLCRNGMLKPNTNEKIVTAYQVLLQYLLRYIREQPGNAFLDDIDELSGSLRKYPSDLVLRLFWCYSQLQYEQPSLALEVWFRLMFPSVENSSYRQFVIEVLAQLTKRNLQNKKFFKSNEPFSIDSYVDLLDLLDRAPPSLSKESRSSLGQSAANLSEIFLINTKSISTHAEQYFSELFPLLVGNKQRSAKSQAVIDRMILASMTDKSIISTWLALHKEYPQNSMHLLSLLNNTETPVPAFSSSKELRQIAQQLQTNSDDLNDQSDHQEFLRTLKKQETNVGKKRRRQSKSKLGAVFQLFLILAVSLIIYQNWLWLTVAADYLTEDYQKHPTVLLVTKHLSNGFHEGKRLTELSIKYADEYARLTMRTLEPYAIQSSKYIQKQWNVILKYIEGPVYDKSVEIAEQIQTLSIVIFKRSTHYLSIFFDQASYYAAEAAQLTEYYLKQFSAMFYDQWTHFDGTALRKKFDELRTRFVKSI